MKHILARCLLILMAAVVVLYAADSVVLRIRMARQTAFSTVTVRHFLSSPMKNHTDDYFYEGAVAEPCVRSIFPHASDTPCWWLKRHATQWE